MSSGVTVLTESSESLSEPLGVSCAGVSVFVDLSFVGDVYYRECISASSVGISHKIVCCEIICFIVRIAFQVWDND